ncbi:hypothetical protein D3C84_991970 [compost metagenome]
MPGATCLNITADDTLSDWETERLLAYFYPQVTEFREPFTGRQAVVSNERAKRLLGWSPDYSWTNQQDGGME